MAERSFDDLLGARIAGTRHTHVDAHTLHADAETCAILMRFARVSHTYIH